MTTHYYHVRCGGKLVYIGPDEGTDLYCCDKCGERGYAFVESWVDDEDRKEDSDLFDLLPTTFTKDGETIVVCGLITNGKDGNRWINDLLAAARKRDLERDRGGRT